MAFSQDIADKICQRLAEGEGLRAICRSIGISHATVFDWVHENLEFAGQYTRAREDGDDAEFERLDDLAEEKPQLGPTGAVDPGWVAWQRNRIDTHKWTIARKRPKKYGDRLQTEVSGSLGVTIEAKGKDEAL